ncbi:MAG: ComF family protein [Candidatus Marinimicrobia bacterium]|jgi:ComF family protein|nr:ComF family protein [Candidatus Neomarinimicrobiota bacterium]MBT3501395.1 ComF family protein [Candidatus Neomarinimicrobiota bacterium]MBT3839466.1 ComF family protein [Candidatus Neomarinimicrobiota bacterium]MBT3998549.1 ComF family protein [Candidatus Neomarinimicrobiota bacterium]MBT4283021.1 ComF family protein [Candidatus Neomarinimicrobiota bacterium]
MSIFTIKSPSVSLGNAFISLLFPNQCLVCNSGEFYSQDPICSRCIKLLVPLNIENRVKELTVKDHIDFAYAGWEFGDELRVAIHSLKYDERAKIGLFLGKELGQYLGLNLIQSLDGLIPVPLHPVKYRERGFNQAEWIAKGLGDNWNQPVWNNLIKRVKHTESQTTLNRDERLNNMKTAFQLNKDVNGKIIGIVDDVLTTGSTISSMANVLKDGGAKQIIALTVTTPLDNNDSYPKSI